MLPITRVTLLRVSYLFAALVLLTSLDAAAAGLSASLDRTRVAEGETVVLTLTAPGDASGTPDPAPLKSDFDLLSQSQSTRMSIVNGRSSTSREWRWVLSPKRTGKLSIPALHLGGDTSVPLTLQVLPAAQAAKQGKTRAVLVEVETQPEEPYVQGQVIYSVRVLSRVPLRQASLSEPEAGDAIVERLGEDRNSTTYRDGQQYQVIERRYAIFPQHSGKLEIAGPVLSAKIPEQGRRRGNLRERLFGRDPFTDMDDFFTSDPFAGMGGIFEQTRPLQLHGRDIALQVRPQPDGAASPWLPAESLTLAESWSPDPPVVRVGEPVTRTLTITAQGLTAAQLPDLQPPAPNGVKVYPDQPQGETRPDGDTLVAQKVLKSALVPTSPGELTLPEVRLSWWDTKKGKAQVASLPAQTLQVQPAAAGAATTPPPPAAAQSPRPDAESPEQATAPAVETAPVVTSPAVAAEGTELSRLGERLIESSRVPAGYWPWVAVVLALAWLASTLLWLRARKKVGPAAAEMPTQSAQPAPNPAKASAAVKVACGGSDARVARQALLDWGAARWPQEPPRRLDELAQRLEGDAAEALRELDRCLYAGANQPWDGTSAWKRLEPALGKEAQKGADSGRDSPLPPLYPQRA